jgi:hypothetical protein
MIRYLAIYRNESIGLSMLDFPGQTRDSALSNCQLPEFPISNGPGWLRFSLEEG